MDLDLHIISDNGGRRVWLRDITPLPWVPSNHPVGACFGPRSVDMGQPFCGHLTPSGMGATVDSCDNLGGEPDVAVDFEEGSDEVASSAASTFQEATEAEGNPPSLCESPSTQPMPLVEPSAPLHALVPPCRPFLRVPTPTSEVPPVQSLAGGGQWVCPPPQVPCLPPRVVTVSAASRTLLPPVTHFTWAPSRVGVVGTVSHAQTPPVVSGSEGLWMSIPGLEARPSSVS